MPIDAYIDGACSGNPGPGGWGVVLVTGAAGRDILVRDLSGYVPEATNNRMELAAAIGLFTHLSPDVHVRVHADSQYVVKGVTEWMANWKRNGWRNASKKPVENQDLWMALDELLTQRGPNQTWIWVKGHAGNIYNERADRLAVAAIGNRAGIGGDAKAATPPRQDFSYIRHSEAFYADTIRIDGTDEFTIQIARDDADTIEFLISTYILGDKAVARLKIFDANLEAFVVLPTFLPAFHALASENAGVMTPDRIAAFLQASGFRNDTPTVNPNTAGLKRA